MEEIKKITSANEYKETNCKTKLVELPSGAVFEIKKVTQRDYLIEGGSVINDFAEVLLSGEKKEVLLEKIKAKLVKMTFEQRKEFEKQQKEFLDNIIIRGTVNPKISIILQPDSLLIDNINDDDYFKLIEEIKDISSLGGNVSLDSFCKESDASNAG